MESNDPIIRLQEIRQQLPAGSLAANVITSAGHYLLGMPISENRPDQPAGSHVDALLAAEKVRQIMAVTPAQIVRVYSGKPGCMCGCRGRYWPKGEPDEEGFLKIPVDDRQIRRILGIIQQNAASHGADIDEMCLWFENETKNYVAYLAQPASADRGADACRN